jgi:hypothetical protein
MSSVSISDMQNFVENMGPMSSSVGNIIELGGEDLGDDLGASLFTSTRVPSRPAGQSVSAAEPIQDIGIGMEPLESISFDLPSESLPEITIQKSSDPFSSSSSSSSSSMFSNSQTASGPSISLAAPTRLSAEEERKKKMELINKLNRLESKGYTMTKRFTMDNTLEEIQSEFERLSDAKSLEASLRFQRQCLMGVATGAEFLNSKFNPFDWELDGWSESVHENIEDFDEVFEELYDKYKGRGNMPPEAKLMMSLVGSGFMFHMSNSFFRSKMSNVDPSDIFRNNPQLAKQFAAAAATQAGPGFGNFMGAAMGVPQQAQQQQQYPQQYQQQQQQQQGQSTGPFYQSSQAPMPQVPQTMAAQQPAPIRREMKGPTSVDEILKTFQEVRAADMEGPTFATSPMFQSPARQAMQEINSIPASPRSDDMESVYTTTSNPQKRGRRKPSVPVGNTMTLNL